MNLTTIRNGLASRLGAVTNLSTFARMPGKIDPPAAIVFPGAPLYSIEGMGTGGAARINFTVIVYAPLGSDWDNAQQILDGYLSSANTPSTSVVDALVSVAVVTDATLGGTLHIATVGDTYQVVQYGAENGPTYLAAELSLYLAMLRS